MSEHQDKPVSKESTRRLPRIGFCVICGATYSNYGNDAWPIKRGMCCNACNTKIVYPRRGAA